MMKNGGRSLPTMISTGVASVACRRSHVPHPCSLKKFRPMKAIQKNANITVYAGTTCSEPLAPTKPAFTRSVSMAGLITAISSSGVMIHATIGPGSAKRRTVFCRKIARLRCIRVRLTLTPVGCRLNGVRAR